MPRRITWVMIRDTFAAVIADRGFSQAHVGRVSGLGGREIWKLLHRRRRGPSAETFLRAVAGLGIRPSEFFALLEARYTIIAPATPDDEAIHASTFVPVAAPAEDVVVTEFDAALQAALTDAPDFRSVIERAAQAIGAAYAQLEAKRTAQSVPARRPQRRATRRPVPDRPDKGRDAGHAARKSA